MGNLYRFELGFGVFGGLDTPELVEGHEVNGEGE